MVSFPSEEDQYATLMDGPRLIYDNYLSVMEWIPNLCPTSDAIKQIVVWVIIIEPPDIEANDGESEANGGIRDDGCEVEEDSDMKVVKDSRSRIWAISITRLYG
ncbi:hypothetical protein KIW84_050569 [Lathyrus oleraceus]|uniref:DUF4283 domain-containing protein n=1 Tax=Pisum sativum TaxID=3888 RepID=A0A9D4WJT4_PEA|nr:hypothetical protein KIW84_050569 [Pisum sativum]